jgi:predicted NAD/FAD-dependent oxidoreductase
MSSAKLKLKRVHIPTQVLIAGRWWKLKPILKTDKKYSKGKEEMDFGACYFKAKQITYLPVQHKEEMLDTLMHEGIHAILCERSYKFGGLAEDEDAIPLLASDILTFLKQIATVELN